MTQPSTLFLIVVSSRTLKQTLPNAMPFRRLAEEVAGGSSGSGLARPQSEGGDDGEDSPNDAEGRSSAAIETALILQVFSSF